MQIPRFMKNIPQWAWYMAGGVTLGGVAIMLWRGRDADQETETVPGQEISETGEFTYGSPGGLVGSPPGVIVPPVLVGGGGADPQAGVPVLQELYVGAVQGLIEGWERVWGPVQDAQLSLLVGNAEALQELAMGGGPPKSDSPMPAPIVNVTMPSQPAPAPVAAPAPAGPPPCPNEFPQRSQFGCYKTVYENRQRDNGQSGAARKVWCNRVTIHRYSHGRAVVVAENKVKNGACP